MQDELSKLRRVVGEIGGFDVTPAAHALLASVSGGVSLQDASSIAAELCAVCDASEDDAPDMEQHPLLPLPHSITEVSPAAVAKVLSDAGVKGVLGCIARMLSRRGSVAPLPRTALSLAWCEVLLLREERGAGLDAVRLYNVCLLYEAAVERCGDCQCIPLMRCVKEVRGGCACSVFALFCLVLVSNCSHLVVGEKGGRTTLCFSTASDSVTTLGSQADSCMGSDVEQIAPLLPASPEVMMFYDKEVVLEAKDISMLANGMWLDVMCAIVCTVLWGGGGLKSIVHVFRAVQKECVDVRCRSALGIALDVLAGNTKDASRALLSDNTIFAQCDPLCERLLLAASVGVLLVEDDQTLFDCLLHNIAALLHRACTNVNSHCTPEVLCTTLNRVLLNCVSKGALRAAGVLAECFLGGGPTPLHSHRISVTQNMLWCQYPACNDPTTRQAILRRILESEGPSHPTLNPIDVLLLSQHNTLTNTPLGTLNVDMKTLLLSTPMQQGALCMLRVLTLGGKHFAQAGALLPWAECAACATEWVGAVESGESSAAVMVSCEAFVKALPALCIASSLGDMQRVCAVCSELVEAASEAGVRLSQPFHDALAACVRMLHTRKHLMSFEHSS